MEDTSMIDRRLLPMDEVIEPGLRDYPGAQGARSPVNYAVLQDGDVADADSDVEDLEQDIEKLNVSVRAFLASQHGVAPRAKSPTAGGGRSAPRGPRKAVEPRGDIKARLFKANRAFMMRNYQEAKDLVFEVIRINAETHQAWTTLGSIFREEGALDKALMSMVYAAHLRPKDVQEWLKCASFALDVAEEHPGVDLNTARMCYSAAVNADPKNMDARVGRAVACHRLGHISLAIADYKWVLAQRPLDLEVVRKLAEACMDSKNVAEAASSAIEAYDLYLGNRAALPIAWYDVGIYTELLAYASRYRDAISRLKSLSRRLLGRGDEAFWDLWDGDDREFDEADERRLEVSEYATCRRELSAYGLGLPRDLRVRLAIYRLTVEDFPEALHHLKYLDPSREDMVADMTAFPFLIRDLAGQLFEHELIAEAQAYYQFLRSLPDEPDALILLQLGRCHLLKGESSAAEECFLAAIEADVDNIDARVELANLYSTAHEDEEALILVNEAMTLQETQAALAAGPDKDKLKALPPSRRSYYLHRPKGASVRFKAKPSGVIPARYRPKRLVDPDMRRREEVERAQRLSTQYLTVQDLKAKIREGSEELVPAWMAAAKELIDDFRSYRKFYSWDKYLKFLGRTNATLQQRETGQLSSLDVIAERLSKAIILPQVPDAADGGLRDSDFNEYQGISFGNWLDLFLDYALSLAATGQYEESYRVCEAAKDSTVFTVSEDNVFFIYITWGTCAIYAGDEETCVSISRQIMRDHILSSDSFRLFSLLCRLCQSSISWYSSGPAQKFILRQIKAMDAAVAASADAPPGASRSHLDVSPLMLYGHILFTSTSYVYAIHYFLRARALDPSNPVINLSLGLGYIHYGLKRQAVNRQYLILQGLGFLLDYYRDLGPDRADEANYGLGRTFQLLGLQHLALQYYKRVPLRPLVPRPGDPAFPPEHQATDTYDEDGGERRQHDGGRVVKMATAFNMYVSYVMSRDLEAAKEVLRCLVL